MKNLIINQDNQQLFDTSLDIYRRLEKDPLMPYTLTSGITLAHTGHLDCGGIDGYVELGQIVQNYKTKDVYEKGFEWCAGMGAFGYHMFGMGLCKHISFNDYYKYAIKIINLTAVNNKIIDKVSAYLTPTISKIPKTEKWDLVVGNPPHEWGEGDYVSELSRGGIPEHMHSNVARCLIDKDMDTHVDFFKNIRNYITDDADLFIVAVHLQPIEYFASLGKLKIANIIKMNSKGSVWTMIHYKPK